MNKQNDYSVVLNNTLKYATDFLNKIDYDNVCATKSFEKLREDLKKPLNAKSEPPDKVISELVKDVDGGLLGSAGGRFFAWVIGGAVPAALAADWLTSTWDQNAALYACSPAEAVIEEVVGEWLKNILGLPQQTSFALTTGCQMAHFTCLAAARNELLKKHSWDVELKGLSGAPGIHILTNRLLHASVERAARFLALGCECIKPLEVNEAGQLKSDSLRTALEDFKDEPVIVQLCAGDINTGMYDNFNEIIPLAHSHNAWVHVDGAFGLWANASDKYNHLLKGVEHADSWATDGHKWLNVPYDYGYAFIKNSEAHKASMSLRASYLTHADEARDQFDWNPEWSRRGRGVSTYAAIRQLGTEGIANLVERCCKYAHDLVIGIGKLKGAEIIWEPKINQGLIRFVHPEIKYTEQENDVFTDMVIERINASGKLFVGGTTWNGRRCMRISICGWQTDEEDIEISIKAVDEVLHNVLSYSRLSHSMDSSRL
ncbi:PLP-dependent enzyme, glutamate decarboxylase [Desulfosporosinus orientis DSM 765]|uniref:PLP-dependent enzyme, glutamate decarboxylase n=1 Tax=Desulfosporosinus orientis (strain ATCC 19365 / DSM 765 / NCIMB 8382 / VKM B-1628 / Singapore I) TaxID=768706 RepID=G7WG75_DESOD|nr:aminotransferase class V-fold PLP-dependent enzyme [Desulfosporosinus orientis]AET70169.1 PLP-dependent enzyme, glutamate decarboxylase [Desulfosporosinus orientis DSM 765]